MCHKQHPSVSPSVCLSVCQYSPTSPLPEEQPPKAEGLFIPRATSIPGLCSKAASWHQGPEPEPEPEPALHHQPLGTQLSTSKKKNPIFFPHPVNGGEILPMPTAKAPLFLRRLLGFFPASSAQPESFPELPSILFLLCENRIKITV